MINDMVMGGNVLICCRAVENRQHIPSPVLHIIWLSVSIYSFLILKDDVKHEAELVNTL